MGARESGRHRASGISDAEACCVDCEWATFSRTNALALGAQHTDRTGHTVKCQQIISVTYYVGAAPNPGTPAAWA